MSKRIQSTVMLFLVGIGFGIFSVVSLAHAKHQDEVVQALIYMIPAVAAFGALIMLPFRQTE